ncbi:MAG: ABC transporter permease [Anaerolineae bacterium]|nr:ABC transporter permease [Anaerolineae bacterium]
MTETAHDFSALSMLPLPDTRPGVVYWRTLRDNLPGAVAWGLGYSVLIVVATVLYPLLDKSNTVFTVLNGLGLLDSLSAGRNLEDVTGFAGYLALQAMSWGPLILAIYLIPQALRAIAQEERQGTLDILLSTPISRWRLLVEKTLAIASSLALILVIVWVSMLASTQALVDVDLEFTHTIASIWHLMPISLVVLSATLLLSVTLREARKAGAIATLFVMVSYFVRALSDFTPTPLLLTLRQASIFSYYRSVAALGQGFQWAYDIPLLLLAGTLFGLAMVAFQRRDLGV